MKCEWFLDVHVAIYCAIKVMFIHFFVSVPYGIIDFDI